MKTKYLIMVLAIAQCSLFCMDDQIIDENEAQEVIIKTVDNQNGINVKKSIAQRIPSWRKMLEGSDEVVLTQPYATQKAVQHIITITEAIPALINLKDEESKKIEYTFHEDGKVQEIAANWPFLEQIQTIVLAHNAQMQQEFIESIIKVLNNKQAIAYETIKEIGSYTLPQILCNKIANYALDNPKQFTLLNFEFNDINFFSTTTPITFSSDGNTIAFGYNKWIKFWDLQKNAVKDVVINFEASDIQFNPQGTILAAVNKKSFMLHDMMKQKSKNFPADTERNQLSSSYVLRARYESNIAFSSDGKYFALGDSSGMITLYDSHDGSLVKRWEASKSWINSVAFSKNVIACSDEHNVKIWDYDYEEPKLIRTLESPDKWFVNVIKVDAEGKLLVVGSSSAVTYWNPESGELKKKLDIHNAENFIFTRENAELVTLHQLSFSFSSLNNPRQIRLWNPIYGQCTRTLKEDKNLGQITINPAGTLLATALKTGKVALWQLSDYQHLSLEQIASKLYYNQQLEKSLLPEHLKKLPQPDESLTQELPKNLGTDFAIPRIKSREELPWLRKVGLHKVRWRPSKTPWQEFQKKQEKSIAEQKAKWFSRTSFSDMKKRLQNAKRLKN